MVRNKDLFLLLTGLMGLVRNDLRWVDERMVGKEVGQG